MKIDPVHKPQTLKLANILFDKETREAFFEEAGTSYIMYDEIVYDSGNCTLLLKYKGRTLLENSTPKPNSDSTLTITGVEGRVKLELNT